MPFQMDYPDSRTGTPHPVSYWAIDRATVYPNRTVIEVVFGGWHDKAARDASLAPVIYKRYAVNATPPGNQTINQFVASIYAYVLANPDDNGVLFFATATQVP